MRTDNAIWRMSKGGRVLSLICASICCVLPLVAGNSKNEAEEPSSVTKEKSIHPSMNKFSFKLECYEDEQGMGYAKKIIIADTKTGKNVQNLTISDYNDGEDAQAIDLDSLDLVLEDLNFDGFVDMRINSFVTAGANRVDICWLWDAGKKQFVHDKKLSEIINLEIDAKEKTLNSFSRVDAATYRGEEYRYIGGKLTLCKEIEQKFKDDGKTAVAVTKELKDGKLVETGRETFVPGEPDKSLGVNILNKMPEKDWRALNVFFSNFSETSLKDFDAANPNAKYLIDFALHHNVINNSSKFEDNDDEEYSYLAEKHVNATIQKYFGIDKVDGKKAKGLNFVSYKKGKYFWEDVFEGAPWFAGSQVVELYDNKDGTFSAILEDYEDNDKYQDNPDNFASGFYAPKKSWGKTISERCKLSGYHTAKIGTHTYNGKKVYKLLKWKAAKTLKKARAQIK